jgi:hypothetical protein
MQSMVLLAAIIVISGTLLTSTLLTAKKSLHELLLMKTQIAMNNTVSDFETWAIQRVRYSNTQTTWPTTFTRNIKATCGLPSCPYWAYSKWLVTGATTALPQQTTTTTNNASAINLATAVDEQRISAQITVTIDDASGKTTFSSATREITARTLNVTPYVVITGVKDSETAVGQVRSLEGDSGGVSDKTTKELSLPDPALPANFTDTRVSTNVDCDNSVAVKRQDNPYADVAISIDHSIRQFGDQDWQYEVPCSPSYQNNIIIPQNLPGFEMPKGRTYGTVPSDGADQWNTGTRQPVFRN